MSAIFEVSPEHLRRTASEETSISRRMNVDVARIRQIRAQLKDDSPNSEATRLVAGALAREAERLRRTSSDLDQYAQALYQIGEQYNKSERAVQRHYVAYALNVHQIFDLRRYTPMIAKIGMIRF